MHRTRSVLMASAVLAMGISSFAVAQEVVPTADSARTRDTLREGIRNGTASRETQIIGNIAASSGNTGGYVTRQSNKSATGGGAIYGCRSTAATGTFPCVRANNLASGKAFEFATASGAVAGTIAVGGGGDAKKPFTTNATGVADGLNADRVDGLNGPQLVTRWALINEQGQIEEQSGGFTVTSAYANANVYVDAGSSLAGKGLSVTVAGQNQVDRDGAAGADPNFAGSVSVSRCATAATVCAPAGTNDANHLVVAPRVPTAPAGGGPITFENTTAATRQRFYIQVTE
jgi:hypothetical protein